MLSYQQIKIRFVELKRVLDSVYILHKTKVLLRLESVFGQIV